MRRLPAGVGAPRGDYRETLFIGDFVRSAWFVFFSLFTFLFPLLLSLSLSLSFSFALSSFSRVPTIETCNTRLHGFLKSKFWVSHDIYLVRNWDEEEKYVAEAKNNITLSLSLSLCFFFLKFHEKSPRAFGTCIVYHLDWNERFSLFDKGERLINISSSVRLSAQKRKKKKKEKENMEVSVLRIRESTNLFETSALRVEKKQGPAIL